MTTAIHDNRPLRALRNVTFFAVLLALLFVAVEMALVPVVNRLLDRQNPAYRVRIVDLDLAPWRGAWSVDGLTVHGRADVDQAPLLEVRHIDAAIDLEALLKGTVVGSITLEAPTARFVGQRGIDMTVATLLRDMLPMSIDRLVIDDGAVFFSTDVTLPSGASRPLDLHVVDIAVTADNLANGAQLTKPLYGSVSARGTAVGWGALQAQMQLSPTAQKPTFDLDASVTGLPLPALNDWSQALAQLARGATLPSTAVAPAEFSSGTLDLFTEIAAKDGRFRGVVKPQAHNVEVAGIASLHHELGSKLVAGLVDTAAKVLTASGGQEAHLAFQGEFSGATVDIVMAVVAALKAALFEALASFFAGELPSGAHLGGALVDGSVGDVP